MKKRAVLICGVILLTAALSGCRKDTSTHTSEQLEQGVSAIEDAISDGRTDNSSQQEEENTMNDVRNGTSADTVATPDDFPKSYDYGSGKISDYDRDAMLRKMPEPDGNGFRRRES